MGERRALARPHLGASRPPGEPKRSPRAGVPGGSFDELGICATAVRDGELSSAWLFTGGNLGVRAASKCPMPRLPATFWALPAAAILLHAGASGARPPECVVDSPQATIDMIAVVPKDAPPFAIALSKVHVVARPTATLDAPVPVEVDGALHFRGLAVIDEYAPKRPQALAGGMLRAGKGSRLVRAGARGGLLRGTMSLAAGSVLIESVSIACGFLEVPAAPSEAQVSGNPEWSVTGGDEPVEFWSSPGWGQKLSVWPGGAFHRVETRGDWTLMAMPMDDGTSLHGWVDASKVSRDGAYGALGIGGYGCGMGFSTHQIIGPAIVRAGTRVSATAFGAPWAVVPQAAKMTVHLYPGATRAEDFAMIEELEGFSDDPVCPGLTHTFIPADSFDWVKR